MQTEFLGTPKDWNLTNPPLTDEEIQLGRANRQLFPDLIGEWQELTREERRRRAALLAP